MALHDMIGNELKRIIFTSEGDQSLWSDKFNQIVLEQSFHGDHDDYWAVVKIRNTGQELERHNIRFIASLIWDTAIKPAAPSSEEGQG